MESPTILHFNCPFCGAHPLPATLRSFLGLWRQSSKGDIEAMLQAYRQILLTVRTGDSRWHTKKFLKAVDRLLTWIDGLGFVFGPQVSIDSMDGRTRYAMTDCPFCFTPRGARPFDRYFTAWKDACRVQTANLFYEAGIVFFAILRSLPVWASPSMLGAIGAMLDLNQKALAAVGLMMCPFCGRHTTALYGDDSPGNPARCRWCVDRVSTFFGATVTRTSDGQFDVRGPADQDPSRLSSAIVPGLGNPPKRTRNTRKRSP